MPSPRSRKTADLATATGEVFFQALIDHLTSQARCRGAHVLRYNFAPSPTLTGQGIELALENDRLSVNSGHSPLVLRADAGGWQRELCKSIDSHSCAAIILRDDLGRTLGLLIAHGEGNPEQLAKSLDLESFRTRLQANLGKDLAEQDMRLLVELAGKTDADFFEVLVCNLARSLQVKMALVAEVLDEEMTRARTIAFCSGGEIQANIEYSLVGTPCEEVHSQKLCIITEGVQDAFPTDAWLQKVGAESYFGIPLLDSKGKSIGHMSVIHDAPIIGSLHEQDLFRLYGAMAAAALSGRLAEQETLTMQRQLMEGQKLESLGTLAGGIAHDFNNLLVGITGHVSLALDKLSPVSPVLNHLQEIEKAGQHAADLAKQMLAYSGKGRFLVAGANLSEIVQEMSHLLQVSIPTNIVLRYQLTDDLPHTEVDPTQIRQVVMNLLLNAVDAIGEEHGTITLITGRFHADASYMNDAAFGADQKEGDYIFLEVADTGCGMDAETKNRAFDPFFSTKQTGRGLGLAAAQGIVKGHEGVLKIYSEVGKGTTFKFLLPIKPVDVIAAKPKEPPSQDLPQGRRLLVIDDEPMVRDTIGQMLSSLGMVITLAESGEAGLKIFDRVGNELDGVLLDMSMPGMSGEETFNAMRRKRQEARVLLMSGYNEQDAISHFAGKGLAGFLQKPFNMKQLRSALLEMFA